MIYNNFYEIADKVDEHYNESLNYFSENQIVICALQGSQNYGLHYEGSDVDTKLIVIPSFKDICLNRKPVSTTHVRANDEHTDWKDIRLYCQCFRKQNLNFLEILFTDFYTINGSYYDQWNRLVKCNEEIARMNPWRAVKSMKGIAMEKYHSMEHPYPSKVDIINKYGYDGKQVSHLLRVDDFLKRYINGESYKECMTPSSFLRDRIMAYKMLDQIPYDVAIREAENYIYHVTEIADEFCSKMEDREDPRMRELLEDVSYNIMKTAVEKELLIK